MFDEPLVAEHCPLFHNYGQSRRRIKVSGIERHRPSHPSHPHKTKSGGTFRVPTQSMKFAPRTGMSAEECLTVGPSHRITFADDRMPAVLATPWLVAHLEYAARAAIAGCLSENERSVGTFVEVEHLAPVPEGSDVVCKARVILVDGPVVTFQVEAFDRWERVANGLHRRRIIDVDRFARRVLRKINGNS